MRDVVLALTVIIVAILGAVVYSQGNDIRSQQKFIEQLGTNVSSRIPTATEQFHLRSDCAAMAQKILDSGDINPTIAHQVGLDETVDSNYDPKTNRCYVELNMQTTSLTISSKSRVANYYLYDGQTGTQLAFAVSQNGQQTGMVFVAHQVVPNATPYDDALEYINDIMNVGQ
jgi:hypothetical protein